MPKLTEEELRDTAAYAVQHMDDYMVALEIENANDRAMIWHRITRAAFDRQQSALSKAAGWTR
jgi:hypothetical protein